MKKKTRYNLIMVAIIVAIVAGGIFGVGYIKGWFDKADGGPVLREIVGVVHIERAGVNYNVGNDTVLRPGDQIYAQTGATAVIAVGDGYITLGGGAEVTVTDVENLNLQLKAGELFVNAVEPVRITFEKEGSNLENRTGISLAAGGAKDENIVCLTVTDAVVAISYRSGAQTVSVFRGTLDDIPAGRAKEYVGGKTTISDIQVESLNSFAIAQIRKANKQIELCVSNEDLDALEEKRRQELEDLLNGATDSDAPAHEHDYEPLIVAATCTQEGYIEYRCTCGETYRDSVTKAKGHSFGQWEVKNAATTQAEGLMERKCQNCDETEQKILEKLPAVHTHDYMEEVVAPTCTENGYTQYVCACGDSFRDNETEKLGHKYESKVIAPTCIVQGYTLYTCACGDSYMDSIQPVAGHKWGDWVTVKEATEQEAGLKERTCTVCGARDEAKIYPTGQTNFVYMTIRCDTILNNMSDLEPGKAEFVPSNGVILPVVKVYFTEGETVFDVLQRVCNEMNIQMEYSWTPMYDSNYIEGINNLYEFDCGSQSGWMYKVNGWFPNYGVSRYEVSAGDQIVFCYTCKGLGTDVGAPEWEGD